MKGSPTCCDVVLAMQTILAMNFGSAFVNCRDFGRGLCVARFVGLFFFVCVVLFFVFWFLETGFHCILSWHGISM